MATAGTIVEDSLLSSGINNFLASVIISEPYAGLAYIDLTTSGNFIRAQKSLSELASEISRIDPKGKTLLQPRADRQFWVLCQLTSPREKVIILIQKIPSTLSKTFCNSNIRTIWV
ncbi:MAG: hypothetical protein CM1200mP3_07860 [Chloroflexota bacterium]|nr:MAG: hypothetical protein CM1200mP3_07860 [Chloroflexota bacterium]